MTRTSQKARIARRNLTIGHNVNSKKEVKPAGETFWGGYAGYFQDPDDHVWEIAWNPQMTIPE